jgi:hypothetical protein
VFGQVHRQKRKEGNNHQLFSSLPLASFAVNFFLLIAERWIPKLLLVCGAN